jgi:DNA polymerase III alpha subunit (gram-positive type)
VIEAVVNLDNRDLKIDEIIELTLIVLQDYDVIYNKNWLVKPSVYKKIFPQTTQNSGITDEMLKNASTIDVVLSDIDKYVSKLLFQER